MNNSRPLRALVGFVGFACLNGFHAAMNLLSRDVLDVITSYGYTVFPLFILMGQIGFNAGTAVRLYEAAHKFIGHIPDGLAMATVMGATAFKAICGSSAATSATFASVAIPEMERYGYDKRLSTGVVATGRRGLSLANGRWLPFLFIWVFRENAPSPASRPDSPLPSK